jgi:hypothetical protein
MAAAAMCSAPKPRKVGGSALTGARRALGRAAPVCVRVRDADILWMRRHSAVLDGIIVPLNSAQADDVRRAFCAAAAARHFGKRVHVKTVASCCDHLAAHVMLLAPETWRIVRGRDTSLDDFVTFLKNNHRALAELDGVHVDWMMQA